MAEPQRPRHTLTQIAAASGRNVDVVTEILDVASLAIFDLPQYQDVEEEEYADVIEVLKHLRPARSS